MKLTEEEIRKITLNAIQDLGENASPEAVKKVVAKAVESMEGIKDVPSVKNVSEGRVILTSFGMNQVGVVASITKAISEAQCDIQDLSQKIIEDFYTMIMVIDITNSPKDLKELQDEMNKIAEKLKIKIYLQHEDVFRYMHRI